MANLVIDNVQTSHILLKNYEIFGQIVQLQDSWTRNFENIETDA